MSCQRKNPGLQQGQWPISPEYFNLIISRVKFQSFSNAFIQSAWNCILRSGSYLTEPYVLMNEEKVADTEHATSISS